MSEILPEITRYGSGEWIWFFFAEAQRLEKAIPAALMVTIRPRSAPPAGWRGWMERGSKIMLKCGRTAYRTADMSGLFSVAQTPRTSALSQVTICPRSAPRRSRGWLERVSHMMLKRDMIAADGRHARTVLCCSDASELFPIPGAVASCQIPQAYPPDKFQEWVRQG